MAHYRGQKALYEAMSRASNRSRAKQGPLSRVQQPLASTSEAEPTHNAKMRWKPKALQLHSGRVELTLPYPAVAVFSIVFVLALVASFRLGQNLQPIAPLASRQPQSSDLAVGGGGQVGVSGVGSQVVPSQSARQAVASGPARPRPGSTIVIQEYHALKDLIPVRDFFDHHEIGTEIVQTDKAFFLFTLRRFSALTLKKGTSEHTLHQRIVELGPSYRAPAGLESFSPNYFRDAYLKPIEENYKGEVVHVD